MATSKLSSILKLPTNNHFHNILRLFDVLPNVPFTTSETMSMVNMAYKHGKYELPDELPNDLRILGN